MTDRGRADLLVALHRELLEREARLKILVEQLLDQFRAENRERFTHLTSSPVT